MKCSKSTIIKYLFQVFLDDDLIIDSKNTHLSSMWGDGFDSIQIAIDKLGKKSSLDIDNILILNGAGAFSYEDDGGVDRSPPILGEYFPLHNSTEIE